MPEQSRADNQPEGLQLEYTPSGRNGSATVTARLAGEVLAVENLNLTKSKARRDFARVVADGRAGIDPAAVEAELLKTAADLASRPHGEGPTDWGNLPELDVSRIIRSERFITPEVSGLAVPTMTTLGEKVVGRWQAYLRWSDGKRERRALGPTIDLPGGRLYVHPEPSEPTPTMRPGWSSEARKRWLSGEPAPNPAAVFQGVYRRIAYFLDLPKPEAPGVTATLALWSVLTYCYQAWPAVPYLYVGGPLGSGKSRASDILTRLVFRPLASSSLTAASLFRTLHTQGGVLLLDEAERLRDTRDPGIGEILSMLLAGYRRGATATRLEPVGDSGFRTLAFEVFGCKALICISGLPPALASRCIPVTMFRAAPGSEKPKRRIDGQPGEWQRLRDELHAVALEYGSDFLGMPDRTDVCPAGIDGRHYELWQPILSLAAWIQDRGAKGLLGLLQEHALATIDSGRDDQTPDHDETLLRLLGESVRFGERPEPGELLRKAQEAEPSGFKSWTARAVTSHLKRYGIPTPKKSMGRRVFRDVTLDHLYRIQDSYGIDLDLPERATVPEEKEAPQ